MNLNIVLATVVDNKDPENLGRVKLQYPFLGESMGENSSPWARILRPNSHTGYGDWTVPEINDEVFVIFENGQFHLPIVIGSIYKDIDSTFQSNIENYNQEKNNIRAIKTRSGHTLIFDDDVDGEQDKIQLNHQKGHKLSIENKKITLGDVTGNTISMSEEDNLIEIKTADGTSIKIDKNIKMEDSNGNKIELTDSEIKIQSSKSIKVKSSGKLTLDGSSGIELGEAAMEAVVKGKTFVQLFNAHTHVGNLGAPSSPPMVPLQPLVVLSQKVKTK
ncbi:MAG: hypothetical protein H6622_01165 [Halobacteriovoraceae bacterium]|nr:hypothetical protein [Halobacteriovoraceae bacterium]